MNNSEIVLYQSAAGAIKIDVILENETVWLTQEQMAQLFDKGRSTMAQQHTPMYMSDRIERLDVILRLNGRELLNHAGKISHEIALEKSGDEFNKYRISQKKREKLESLEEIENDIKSLKKKDNP